jgi:hypothetical protein
MKLWLLRPRETLMDDDNPWEPWYDKAFGFVVRAETEEKARELITRDQKSGGFSWNDHYGDEGPRAWADPKYSWCEEITQEGQEQVIIRDFASA